jgi:hypothetical protein
VAPPWWNRGGGAAVPWRHFAGGAEMARPGWVGLVQGGEGRVGYNLKNVGAEGAVRRAAGAAAPMVAVARLVHERWGWAAFFIGVRGQEASWARHSRGRYGRNSVNGRGAVVTGDVHRGGERRNGGGAWRATAVPRGTGFDETICETRDAGPTWPTASGVRPGRLSRRAGGVRTP